jgi:hypothetical protein
MAKKISHFNRLLGTVLILVLIFTVALSAFLNRTSSEPNTTYYLTNQRGDSPYTQYLLKSDTPTSSSPSKITHPNNFIWRTDFQPSVLNFSSGSWSFILWFETNESASCKLSLGYFTGFVSYIPITDTDTLHLDQAGTKEYNFIFNDVPAFNVPPGGCFAFQLNASTANLYIDSTDKPSNIQFSTQQQTTTTTQSETQTTESTPTQQTTSPSETQTESTSETPSTSSITSLTETGDQTSTEYFTLTVHAHPIETQYPMEPTTELNAVISIEYFIDGVNKTETKSTLFIIETDKGSVVNLTVASFPPGLNWVEWNEYGTGRTSDFNISIYMNSDKNAIAYFSTSTSQNTTSTEGGNVVYVIPGFTATSILIGFLFAAIAILLVRAKRIHMMTSL